MKNKETLSCICSKQGCWHDEKQPIPAYCHANKYPEEMDSAKGEYSKRQNLRIYEAACKVGSEKNGFRPRIEEALHFAKELELSKIGFAACVAFETEMEVIDYLFKQDGLEVVCAGCQIGSVTAEDRSVPQLKGFLNETCNPIAQAEILNRNDTELNFIVGLCMGHDILFTRYSNAPVSTLIVKDRMMANNPSAAVYGWHARKHLFDKDNYRKASGKRRLRFIP